LSILAGNLLSLKAAVNNGANVIYIGFCNDALDYLTNEKNQIYLFILSFMLMTFMNIAMTES